MNTPKKPDDFNIDSLPDELIGEDDIVAGINLNSVRKTPLRGDPFSRAAGFVEKCPACGGSGKFRSWSGCVIGDCFKCEGRGSKTFKSSPESRAKGRARGAVKAAEREAGKAAWREEHKAELSWLEAAACRQTENMSKPGAKVWRFPIELAEKFAEFGVLTDGQLNAVRTCMVRDANRAQERAAREASAPVVNADKLEAAFATAREKAARPGQVGIWVKPLNLRNGPKDDPNALNVTFTPGSIGSQWEGLIFVKAGEKKLGMIKEGKFQARFECTPVEQKAVIDCCTDPATAAVAFGKAWGICAVCHRTLTNDISIERGIGPICAERFGF
jgi:hypothetical protein